MRLPSGLNRGCMSNAGPLVIRVAADAPLPSIGIDVDVAEQIEDDALAVGADVDVHPRPFVRVERQLRRRPEIGGDVPLLGGRLAAARRRRRARAEA